MFFISELVYINVVNIKQENELSSNKTSDNFRNEDFSNREVKDAENMLVCNLTMKDKNTCRFCRKTFSSSSVLRTHLKAKVCTRSSYKCDGCGKKFKNEALYESHWKEKKCFSCWKCHAFFKNQLELKEHCKETDCPEAVYKCEKCKKQFVTEYLLQLHKNSKTCQKVVICTHCSAMYSTVGYLQRHMYHAHGINN